VHLFFAEREARKIPTCRCDQPSPVRSAAIIGAGTMGGGIAMNFATPASRAIAGVDPGSLGPRNRLIKKNYAASVTRGSLTQTPWTVRYR